MVDPSLSDGNKIERTPTDLRLGSSSITETTSSEPIGLEHKATRPPPAASTGPRAFNAADKLPPNPIDTTTVMMDRVPVKSYFP